MKQRKLFRGPFFWIAIAIAVMVFGFNSFGGQSFKQVHTSVGLQLIKDGGAKSVLVIENEQRVDVVLNSPDLKYGDHIQFYYVAPRGTAVTQAISDATITDGYNDQVNNTPWYISLLFSILPFLLIAGLFWFMMSSAQGSNNRAMQFGKSRAKLCPTPSFALGFGEPRELQLRIRFRILLGPELHHSLPTNRCQIPSRRLPKVETFTFPRSRNKSRFEQAESWLGLHGSLGLFCYFSGLF